MNTNTYIPIDIFLYFVCLLFTFSILAYYARRLYDQYHRRTQETDIKDIKDIRHIEMVEPIDREKNDDFYIYL